ncbi:MAG: Rrf2 family transcriptional regulator [Desulfobacterales bacterium]|jgi:Rrf2 family protein
MFLTHKRIQYTIRAIVELAKYFGQGPRKISDIAEAQFIPLRFLEVILGQLKGSGMVSSKRGFYGGYVLNRDPREVTVGDIVRYMQGQYEATTCFVCESEKKCPFSGDCVFSAMWRKVKKAVFDIYDETSVQDLLESHLTKLSQVEKG